MAVQTRSKKAKKATTNGHVNGRSNGYANGHMNGHAEKRQLSTSMPPVLTGGKKPGTGVAAALTSIIARYPQPNIVNLLFGVILTGAGWRYACTYAAPYVDPYYQTYVTPHIERLKPYVERFETHVYTPAATFTQHAYASHGAGRVKSAKVFVAAQYHKSVQPQLQHAQKKIQGQYDVYFQPHIETASAAVAPYVGQTKASLEEIFDLSILPAYEASLPYLRKFRSQGHYYLVHIIYPQISYARDTTWAFLVRTVWPRLRVLYGDNVEPQLVRISERLGRYRDQQKIESFVDTLNSRTEFTQVVSDVVPSSVSESSPTSEPSYVSATKAGWGVFDDLFGGDAKSTVSHDSEFRSAVAHESANSESIEAELREKLDQDLRTWQTKFAIAADKGAEDLQQRVTVITKRQLDNSVNGQGKALLIRLEETTNSTLSKVKSLIKKTIESIPENATEEDLELAHQHLGAKTREYGLTVKEKAQDIRIWRAAYDRETDSLVQAAVSSTVEVLEKIHGLGLQEVGMRWAWTDGVSYKDWQNYHQLRETLNEWQAEVEAVGSKHEGLRIAHEEAEKLEDEAMKVASNMVAELVRLKNVSKWKIWAGDATDDFSEKKIPVRVYNAVQQLKNSAGDAISQASNGILGSSTPLTESIASSIKSAFSEATSHVSAAVEMVTPRVPGVKEKQGKVFGGVNAQVFAEARQVVLDEPIKDDDGDETYFDKLQDIAADSGERAAELSRIVSQAILGHAKTTGSVESISSLASAQYVKALAAASNVIYGTEQWPIESVTSVASAKFDQAVTAVSFAIYGTPRPTAIMDSAQALASSRYDDAVSLASKQLEGARSQLSLLVSGKPKPAHQTMLSYLEMAYSDSMSAASERLSAAFQYTETVKHYVASPTQGYFESVSSIASSRLAEAIKQASTQFSPAQPTGVIDSTRRQYYEAIGLAHARYSEFIDAASNAVYGPQQGTMESLASVASASAASAASYMLDSAQSAAAKAQDAVEAVVSQASSGVIGSETPLHVSIASQASRNWDALISQASSQVYGKPTPWLESAYSQVGAYGAQATDTAAQQYADIQALMAELLVGKEPTFTESVMKRFSSAYHTGVPAAVASIQSYANEQVESAGSYASEGYEAATNAAADIYASATSVVNSIFTPPAMIEDVMSQASASLDIIVESASIALYGTSKGAAERASESVASAYSSVQSRISAQVYKSQDAFDSFSSAAVNAQAQISQAIFGTPTATDYVASATSGAAGAYSLISSAVSANVEYAASIASSAVLGPEQGAMESANSRIFAAVEMASSKINEMYAQAPKQAEEIASSVSSAAAEATDWIKDEL